MPLPFSSVNPTVKSRGHTYERISKALKTSADYLLSGEKTDVDKSFELYELSEKLKNASPEQLEKINQMIDVIKN